MFETKPMPLDAGARSDPALDEFRVTGPREIQFLLKQFLDGNVFITLASPSGQNYTTTIWTLDAQRGVIGFAADLRDPRVERLLEDDEMTAVGYLDSIKVQFDLQGIVLVRGKTGAVLNAQFPGQVFRIQRRSSYRVRPLHSSTPTAKLPHPAIPDMHLALRVLDVSVGGVALLLPGEFPDIEPGSTVNEVQIDLDADTRLSVNLCVHHVTVNGGDSGSRRLGCEMLRLAPDAERILQRYIDSTQKRRRMLSL